MKADITSVYSFPYMQMLYTAITKNTAASFKQYHSSPFTNKFLFFVEDVEAMACRRAINFAAEIGIHEVIIEGDAQIVIVQLRGEAASFAQIGEVINDCQLVDIVKF